MLAKNILAAAAVSFAAMSVFAGDTSESALVYVNPAKSYLWRTARSRTMTLPVPYPTGATCAVLNANGRTLASGVSAPTVTFTLPEPRSNTGEDVYELEMIFDKGPSATARLGLVKSCADASSASTAVRSPAGTTEWNKAGTLAVIPVPFEAASLTAAIDGGDAAEIDTGLDGAAGWFALKLGGGETAVLAADAPEGALEAELKGSQAGFSVIVR